MICSELSRVRSAPYAQSSPPVIDRPLRLPLVPSASALPTASTPADNWYAVTPPVAGRDHGRRLSRARRGQRLIDRRRQRRDIGPAAARPGISRCRQTSPAGRSPADADVAGADSRQGFQCRLNVRGRRPCVVSKTMSPVTAPAKARRNVPPVGGVVDRHRLDFVRSCDAWLRSGPARPRRPCSGRRRSLVMLLLRIRSSRAGVSFIVKMRASAAEREHPGDRGSGAEGIDREIGEERAAAGVDRAARHVGGPVPT